MGKAGKVQIKLSKPFYTAGETIEGAVFLDLKEAIDVDKVYVKIKGKEKVCWKDEWTTPVYEEREGERVVVGHEEHEKEYEEKESFFKKKIKLLPDCDLEPGKYQFPFSFDLPKAGKKGSKLSGSFAIKEKHCFGFRGARGKISKLKSKIEYSAKVVVDIDDCKDLESKADFVVYGEQNPRTLQIPRDEKEENVYFCCCINRGSLKMEGSLEKAVYAPGETAKAILKVENNSSLEVTAMVELNRILKLKADGHQIYNSGETHLGRFDTIGPGETKTVDMVFQIPDIAPSTHSRGVECYYVLDLVSELQCAPDIELHFPVHVLQPPIPPKEWEKTLGNVQDYIVAGKCEIDDMKLKAGYATMVA